MSGIYEYLWGIDLLKVDDLFQLVKICELKKIQKQLVMGNKKCK